MNKKTLYNIFLIGCPAVAIAIAAAPQSVEIRERATGVSTYQSYFALLPESCFSLSMILSVAIAAVTLAFAIIYVVSGDEKWLKSIYLTSFISVLSGEIPTMLQTELLIIPFLLLVPILVMVTCAMAYYKMKKPQQGKKKNLQGQRLQPRR